MKMRRFVVAMLVAAVASLSAQGSVFAQTLSAVSGQAVDASGRAVAGQRVELVQSGTVLQTTTTGSRGEWSFGRVDAGEYVVRMNVNGQTAGMRVSVVAGQTVANQMIVAPTASQASGIFFIAPLVAALGVPGAVLVSTVVIAGLTYGVYEVASS
jgi:hypothetical protein